MAERQKQNAVQRRDLPQKQSLIDLDSEEIYLRKSLRDLDSKEIHLGNQKSD